MSYKKLTSKFFNIIELVGTNVLFSAKNRKDLELFIESAKDTLLNQDEKLTSVYIEIDVMHFAFSTQLIIEVFNQCIQRVSEVKNTPVNLFSAADGVQNIDGSMIHKLSTFFKEEQISALFIFRNFEYMDMVEDSDELKWQLRSFFLNNNHAQLLATSTDIEKKYTSKDAFYRFFKVLSIEVLPDDLVHSFALSKLSASQYDISSGFFKFINAVLDYDLRYIEQFYLILKRKEIAKKTGINIGHYNRLKSKTLALEDITFSLARLAKHNISFFETRLELLHDIKHAFRMYISILQEGTQKNTILSKEVNLSNIEDLKLGAQTVNNILKRMIENNFITRVSRGRYKINDRFFADFVSNRANEKFYYGAYMLKHGIRPIQGKIGEING